MNHTEDVSSAEIDTGQDILSPDTLVYEGGMEIVNNRNDNGLYHVGFFQHSNKLTTAIRNGHLDQFFIDLTNTYRDVYGRGPWKEYLTCVRRSCSEVLGISDVYISLSQQNSSLVELERTRPVNPSDYLCPACSEPMGLFYPIQKTLQSIIESFQKQIFAIFLFSRQQQSLVGFCYGWYTNFQQIWEDKLADMFPGLEYETYLQKVSDCTDDDISDESQVFYMSEWGIALPHRSSGMAIPLAHSMLSRALQEMEGEDPPAINYTSLGSKAHKIMGSAWGFQDVYADKNTKTVITFQNLRKFVEGMMPPVNQITLSTA